MSKRVWRLIERCAGLLQDPAERQAVLGDLQERDVTGGRALFELWGLIVRREMGLWATWRPWTAMVLLIFPVWVVVSPAFTVAYALRRHLWEGAVVYTLSAALAT